MMTRPLLHAKSVFRIYYNVRTVTVNFIIKIADFVCVCVVGRDRWGGNRCLRVGRKGKKI